MRIILLENGLDIIASQESKYNLVISASMGKVRFDEIKHWIQSNLKQNS
jgi:death-on-curing protein